MKKYVVELSQYGAESKTIGLDNYQWTIFQGQIIKESALTKNFPQYFVDYIEDEVEVEIPVSEIKVEEPVTVEETVVEEVKVEEPVTVEETVVEEANVTQTDDEILAIAKSLKTKNELDEYSKSFGIELNKQKSLKYMLTDFETALKAK